MAGTIFQDPHLVTTADLTHSESEERWFSVGYAANGLLVSVVYVWLEPNSEIARIRLIFMPASIEKNLWAYIAGKAQQQGVELSALLTEVLQRDIEINEALK